VDHPVEGRRERLRHHPNGHGLLCGRTTIKIELNLKLTGSHPEQGNLRADICFNRRQLWRKYSAGRLGEIEQRSICAHFP
jgi:hypothetical protein